MAKKHFRQSANPDKPFLELELSYIDKLEAFQILIHFLFDIEFCNTGNPKSKKGLVYNPGLYIEHYKPDLELALEKETDKMYITISGFDGNRRILMNPKYLKRINSFDLSNNIYEVATLKHSIIESAIKNLKEEYRAVLFYFLYPAVTLESLGIKKFFADKVNNIKRRNAKVKKLEEAVNYLVSAIIIIQNRSNINICKAC